MASSSGNIVIRIMGEGISPRTLSTRELSEILLATEKSVASISDLEEDDADEFTLGLVSVQGGSAHFELAPRREEVQVAAFNRWTESIRANDYRGLPTTSVEGAQTIAKFSRRRDCRIQLASAMNGRSSEVTVTPTTEVDAPEPVYVQGTTTVYGRLIQVGGVKPKAKLRLPSGNLLVVSVTSEQARRLAGSIYDVVGIRGEATWNADGFTIENFQVQKLVPFEDTPPTEGFRQLRENMGKHFDDVDDPTQFIRDIRGRG
jgi:hypothetical protein